MLKTIFTSAVVLLLLPAVVLAAQDDEARRVQRVAALVDYVAADYGGAVQDGKIISQSEFEEQMGLLREAQRLVPQLAGTQEPRDAVGQKLQTVVDKVEAKASFPEVQQASRAVRTALQEKFQLHMVPAGPISLTRAASQFQMACASCHGANGRADGPLAQSLKPPPVSFHDPEKMARISPTLAFHALTFGIPGTAMAPFDVLSAGDRWNLAFYVVGLRHQPEDEHARAAVSAMEGKEVLSRLGQLALLAERSDAELLDELLPAFPDPRDRERALSYLRTRAPLAAPDGRKFLVADRLLSQIASAAEKGQLAGTHQLALDAYLDGFEPHEAALRAQDADLMLRIEQDFLDLRQLTDGPHPDAAAIAKKARSTQLLLAEAEQKSGDRSIKSVAFVAALVIALREGLEAALLIAALLAFLRKSGRARQARLVHLGWGLAVPAGLVTFLLSGSLISGAQRELAEAVTTFLAAAMLLTVTHWVLGAREAKNWLGFLRRRVDSLGGPAAQAGDRTDHAMGLLGLAFFAAYREAFEVVLFYRALLLDVGEQAWRPVLLGAGSGTLIMVAVVILVGRIGRRLNPRPVMLFSSVLLMALALSLAGHGVRSLQEGGYLGISPLSLGGHELPSVPALGLYATWQGLLLQGVVLLLLFLPQLLTWARRPEVPIEAKSPPKSTQSAAA